MPHERRARHQPRAREVTSGPKTPLPPLRETVRAHGLSASKALGQNFLLDLNLTQKIARTAGPIEDHTVIEVGPDQTRQLRVFVTAPVDAKLPQQTPITFRLVDKATGVSAAQKDFFVAP